ncbi:hypothetical protein BH09PAT4_BH09PAT4_07250 [soil metagenome]
MSKESNVRILKSLLLGVFLFIILLVGGVMLTGDYTDDVQSDATTNPGQMNAADLEVTTTPSATLEKKEQTVPAEYVSALNKAYSYAKTMNMSKAGIYDQLTSEYGEKFTANAAQYAIDNVQADWKANALAKAQSYQSDMDMSPAAIHDQLVSSYGEKFTVEEADYAIAHLNE